MDDIQNSDYRKEHNTILDAYADDYLLKEYPDLDFKERNYSHPAPNPSLRAKKPDIVGRDIKGKERFRVEIETPGLVTMKHAQGHWDAYANFKGVFHLIVPLLFIEQADKILDELGIGNKTLLRGYAWNGTRLRIFEASDLVNR